MSRFDKYIAEVLRNEGGYVNDSKDAGGETKFGISKRAYPEVNIKDLTIEKAKEIYRKDYWNPLYEDLTDEHLSFRLFDVGVNLGVRQAVKKLQQTMISSFSCTIKVDGDFGAKTLAECNRIGKDLYPAYVRTLSEFYTSIAERRPENKAFLRGWLTRLNRQYV